MDSFISFSSIASNKKIDVEKGIIYGVSIITEGEAAGRNSGTWIDSVTLSQIDSIICSLPDGIKVKLSQHKEHDGSAGQIVGTIKNARVEGQKLGGDLHLLTKDENFSKIIEMAQNMPSQFGLSIVSPKHGFSLVKKGDKNFLRCSELSSVDLVEAPAANNGLFLSKHTNSMSIKYAKGDSGDHAKDCECKECMSKHSKKEMSAMIADLLGLSADADESAVKAAFTALVDKGTAPAPKTDPAKPATVKLSEDPDFVALSRQLKTIADNFEASTKAANESAKLAEIRTLVAAASGEGKVVPLTEIQLSKMDIADVKEMFSKLPKGQVKLSKTATATGGTQDAVPTFKNNEERIQFCRTQAAKGAAQLAAEWADQGIFRAN